MTTTINGRTPEEIKKGLECCKPKWVDDHWKTCDTKCPYIKKIGGFCRVQLMADALALIQQLERELDAAVERCVDADDVSAGLYQELKAAQPKWISVEERLPEDGAFAIFYYVKNEKNMMAVGCYFDYGMFIVEGHSVNVTHWMPLPSTEGLHAT